VKNYLNIEKSENMREKLDDVWVEKYRPEKFEGIVEQYSLEGSI